MGWRRGWDSNPRPRLCQRKLLKLRTASTAQTAQMAGFTHKTHTRFSAWILAVVHRGGTGLQVSWVLIDTSLCLRSNLSHPPRPSGSRGKEAPTEPPTLLAEHYCQRPPALTFRAAPVEEPPKSGDSSLLNKALAWAGE